MPAGTYARRILEKLLVDLSWASSRMEGNTYSLLDTERLIRFGEEAAGKDRKEAIMILNHKEAIQHLVRNLPAIGITRRDDIHRNVAPEVNEVTVWRRLKALVEDHKLQVSGRGPSTRYSLAGAAVVRAHLATPYNQRKLGARKKKNHAQYGVWKNLEEDRD